MISLKEIMILGQGAYGAVCARDGKAVKKFSKLSHIIQEYIALQYLNDCQYVVKTKGVNFSNLELEMELFDCSLRKWLEDKSADKPDMEKIHILSRDVLLGLIELHDRSLVHGDLKPGNILVRLNPLGAVLGDCGFVSIYKYAKVDRTAPIYRETVISHDPSHDMFSFGICLLEMIADIKIYRQPSYQELSEMIRDRVRNPGYKKILYNLLHEDKDRRPTARNVLYMLYRENPPQWIKPDMASETTISHEDNIHIRKLMKATAYKFGINRGKKGYGALISYINNHKTDASVYQLYTGVTLMILSALFGKSGFRQEEVYSLCGQKYTHENIHKALEEMSSDYTFLNILLAP